MIAKSMTKEDGNRIALSDILRILNKEGVDDAEKVNQVIDVLKILEYVAK